MLIGEIKQQLHQAIDAIEDESYLQALVTILYSKQNEVYVDELSKEQVSVLIEREENFSSGQKRAMPLNEFKAAMKKKYGL